jgi:glucose-6-phosphate isomerase
MNCQNPKHLKIWEELVHHAERMKTAENHLRNLTKRPNRFGEFSVADCGMLFDFSRQRIDTGSLAVLFELAESLKLTDRFKAMSRGEIVNTTEKRAALHTATRSFSSGSLISEGVDIVTEMNRVRDTIREFSNKIHNQEITGPGGEPFSDVVVIGIGGSYLGAQFVSRALEAYADTGITLHFLSNVDIHAFFETIGKINAEKTLWIVISKSFTTAETTANLELVRLFLTRHGLDPEKQIVAVTAKGSPGDTAETPFLNVFHMFDVIGGRFSVTSAVGGLPLSLYLGYDRFEEFLRGAEAMDLHAANSDIAGNMPLLAALFTVWNKAFLGYSAMAIVPYVTPLEKLAAHIQQLHMESIGKSVTTSGEMLTPPAGSVIFGEPGTNAQHSFFQAAHQGDPFPIEFIGIIQPFYEENTLRSNGVTNHQELWANLIAQPAALAEGDESGPPHKQFSGNRPSTTILLQDLSPDSIGRLLAFYEAKTVYEGFLWGINPFDQFGVELGKSLAEKIRREMAARNQNPGHVSSGLDSISRSYVDLLFSKRLP